MHQTREGSLDAQTSEQQEGSMSESGFGSQICALGNSENKITLNKYGGKKKSEEKRSEKT